MGKYEYFEENDFINSPKTTKGHILTDISNELAEANRLKRLDMSKYGHAQLCESQNNIQGVCSCYMKELEDQD